MILINNYLKNLVGWRTNRRLLVISVDDYGNVRLASKHARDSMDRSGLKIQNRFDALDTLETSDDLAALFEVLSAFKDQNGNHPVFTAFSVPVNIDFEKMSENNFSEYQYELLPQTYRKLGAVDASAYKNGWIIWKEGIRLKLIHPEFHGREHLNLKVFNEKLKRKDAELITSLKNRSYSCISNTGYPTIKYTAAFEFNDFNENFAFESIITDGLEQFYNVFGKRALHFNAPGGRENSVIHEYLKNNGILFLDTPFIKSEHQGNGKYKKSVNYTGRHNNLGQTFIVRNCVFEPTEERNIDWVEYTFRQVEAAFFLKKPAIISSHRVNFSGYIDESNRRRGLDSLKRLLNKILLKYPDIEFFTAPELGNLINYTLRKVG